MLQNQVPYLSEAHSIKSRPSLCKADLELGLGISSTLEDPEYPEIIAHPETPERDGDRCCLAASAVDGR